MANRDVTRGDELLQKQRGADEWHREELRQAFVAGYRARELDTRADDKLTRKIAERKFELWMKGREND